MPHARFLITVLYLSISGGMLLGGLSLADERDAIAASRRTVKATAGRATSARRSSDAPASDPPASTPRTSEASPGVTKYAPSRDRNAPPEKFSTAKAVERTGASNSAESASNTKLAREGTKAENTASRNPDPRASAAKAPTETASSVKSTTERIASESSAAVPADTLRAAVDPSAPTVRRELASSAGATPATRPVLVTLEGPTFDGGDVPRAAAALDRMKGPFARCASIENALTRNDASIDLRFLVRAPGRAEGVDVDKVRGVSSDVVRCVTSVLARSYVGAPSDDPVGVAVTVRLKRPEPAPAPANN